MVCPLHLNHSGQVLLLVLSLCLRGFATAEVDLVHYDNNQARMVASLVAETDEGFDSGVKIAK